VADNKVSVELTIEQAQALSALSNLNRGLDEFAKKASASTSKAENSFSSFGQTVAAVFSGQILVEFAKKAVEALASIPAALQDVIKAGAESEAATNKLGIALAISGNASEDTASKFEGLATSISKLTGVDDDAVKSAATLALTLGATDAQAEKILKTAADLAVGLGVDFNTAAQQLSQTLEGSAGKLGKVSNAVKKLDEDALKSGAAIDILAKQFGGLAQANAGNVEVQLKNISVNVDNLKKSFGEAVVENVAFKGALLILNDGLEQFNTFIKENKGSISDFTTATVDGIKSVVEVTAVLIDTVGRAGAVLKNVFELGIGSIALAMNAANAAILTGGNAIREFFGLEPNPAVVDAFDSLGKSIESVTQDSADLQKALGPDAFVPGTQAVINLAESTDAANARIQESDRQTEENKKNLAAQGLANRQAERAQQLAEEQAFQDQVLAIKQTALVTQLEAEAQSRDHNIIFRTDETAAIQQFELTKINLQFDAQASKLALMADGKKKEQELELNAANRSKAIAESTTKFELEQQKIRNQNLRGSLDSIATLTSQSNKELFAIGKASALATATIDGIAAVQKALASAPPPFNFVLAALVGTVQALNLSKIASQQPPSFAQGGIVPGTSFVGDKVAANVNSGEMVLNKQQQANLFDQANGGGSSGGVVAAIESLGNKIAAIQQQIIIDGREIARVVRDQREAGFAV
jgi:hypothetical protein